MDMCTDSIRVTEIEVINFMEELYYEKTIKEILQVLDRAMG
jgi:hypothetical protein